MKATAIKITKTTFKSFINKNRNNLLIKVESRFDGMTDCVEEVKSEFYPAKEKDSNSENTLGFEGIWLVNGGRDSFYHYEDSLYIGIEYYNCCGSGIIAIAK